MPQNTYLTIADVAGLLNVHTLTIRRMIGAGRLPAYKFGRRIRLEQADIDAYIKKNKVIPAKNEREPLRSPVPGSDILGASLEHPSLQERS